MMAQVIPDTLWWCAWQNAAVPRKPDCPPLHRGTSGICGRCAGAVLVAVKRVEVPAATDHVAPAEPEPAAGQGGDTVTMHDGLARRWRPEQEAAYKGDEPSAADYERPMGEDVDD
jgi:hypothetical protein